MNHIMLDLETWGTSPGSAIRSIGAVRFDVDGVRSQFYVNVDDASCEYFGLKRDESTKQWWSRQDEAAQAVFAVDPVSLPTALHRFVTWAEGPDCVWGNGANFDNVIIAAAFRACGVTMPWRYFQDRCYRTIATACPDLKRVQVGTHHVASDDALSQVIHLLECCKKLNLLSHIFRTGENE